MKHGFYTTIRYRGHALKQAEQQLRNAPLGKRKRKELERTVAQLRKDVRAARQGLRELNKAKRAAESSS